MNNKLIIKIKKKEDPEGSSGIKILNLNQGLSMVRNYYVKEDWQ